MRSVESCSGTRVGKPCKRDWSITPARRLAWKENLRDGRSRERSPRMGGMERTTAWIIMLQQNGVINGFLVWIGVISEDGRIQMVYNET